MRPYRSIGRAAMLLSRSLAHPALEAGLGDGVARPQAGERAREFALSELSAETIGPRYIRIYKEAAA
jgi:hypothetical protein